VSYFNFHTDISQNIQQIQKNVLNKSCKVRRGTKESNIGLILGNTAKVRSRSLWIF